ncbi:protein of unknown function [Magnetospirillum sp. XM-1]|nr:protein of unknown function [Magnetospirillum sp. XM-1]
MRVSMVCPCCATTSDKSSAMTSWWESRLSRATRRRLTSSSQASSVIADPSSIAEKPNSPTESHALVAPAGIEPARPKASDFKSLASTSSAKGPWGSGALITQPRPCPKRRLVENGQTKSSIANIKTFGLNNIHPLWGIYFTSYAFLACETDTLGHRDSCAPPWNGRNVSGEGTDNPWPLELPRVSAPPWSPCRWAPPPPWAGSATTMRYR